MSLINCPECNKQISSSADACPNCGHPVKRVPIEPVVAAVPERREETFPIWAIVPLVILGVIVIFGLIYMLQEDERADDTNINVNVDTQRETARSSSSVDVPVRETDPGSTGTDLPSTTELPETSTDQTIGTDTRTDVVDADSDQGKVELEARVADSRGNVRAVRAEKFYLLDEDLETILSDADLDRIQNQTLTNSFGLSVLYPDRYRDFNTKALKAINDHIKYKTQTDATGKASINGVKPDSYYLFGIHQVGKGFAIWSSPVTITGGVNNLNIQPQRTTEPSQ